MSLSHVTAEQIQAGLPDLYLSPKDSGPVRLIVCRPSTGARVLLDEAELDPAIGLRGDSWQIRGSSRTEDGSANPDAQLTMMNSRVIALLAGDQENWGRQEINYLLISNSARKTCPQAPACCSAQR